MQALLLEILAKAAKTILVDGLFEHVHRLISSEFRGLIRRKALWQGPKVAAHSLLRQRLKSRFPCGYP